MGLVPLTDADRQRLDAAADLKGELVDFALSPPLEKHLRHYRKQVAGLRLEPLDELIVSVETLLYEHRFDDGSTVLDRFLARRRGHTDEQHDLIRSWNDSVHGYFEVVENAGGQLLLLNLLDELTYPSYASQGAESIVLLEPGGFVLTRVVPVGEHWMLSGTQRYFPATERPRIAQLALELSMTRPDLVLRSPEKRRQAERINRMLHESFLDCFGTDRLLVKGQDVAETHQRFLDHHVARVQSTQAAQAAGTGHPRAKPPKVKVTDDPTYDSAFADAGTVAVIHREDSGIWFFVGYDLVAGAFADPGTLDRPEVRAQVRGYLEDDSIPGWLFDELHAQHPDQVDTVWSTVLERPGFTWSTDGPDLLHRHKPDDPTSGPRGSVPSPSIAVEQLTVG